ncbi:1-acyl-sn-glycerol-3-phosphate acyltransferase [Streptomyces sp. NBC_01525]|uniref:lysophospholipid acyltransferase family protein n=1 Tax=Streptomyces sp. NBC_01525 TaxID=2903893 RepID=UPI0038675C9F
MSRILLKAILGFVMRVLYRPTVEGVERIPQTGPVILAGNHVTFIDSLFLSLVVKRPVYFIGKDSYVTGKGLKGRLMAWFFRSSGMIPVDRDGGRGGVAALMTGRRILEQGHAFGIYPEGTRSPDGRLYRGRTGIARLTLMTGAPVVPFAMIGTDKVQPDGKGMPRIAKVTVRFGEPLGFSRYDGMDRDRYVLRAVTDEVMSDVMELSGQEYVDMYATKARAA